MIKNKVLYIIIILKIYLKIFQIFKDNFLFTKYQIMVFKNYFLELVLKTITK